MNTIANCVMQSQDAWLSHFIVRALDGEYDHEFEVDDRTWFFIDVTSTEKEVWPELRHLYAVCLCHTPSNKWLVHIVSEGYNQCMRCGIEIIDAAVCDDDSSCEEVPCDLDDKEDHEYASR